MRRNFLQIQARIIILYSIYNTPPETPSRAPSIPGIIQVCDFYFLVVLDELHTGQTSQRVADFLWHFEVQNFDQKWHFPAIMSIFSRLGGNRATFKGSIAKAKTSKIENRKIGKFSLFKSHRWSPKESENSFLEKTVFDFCLLSNSRQVLHVDTKCGYLNWIRKLRKNIIIKMSIFH